jgi:hypothetical protein
MSFYQGDKVRYVGQRFAQELHKKKITSGEVCAQVQNQEGAYVVEFGDDSYVMGERSLIPWRPSAKELAEAAAKETGGKEAVEVVVTKKRRRIVGEED